MLEPHVQKEPDRPTTKRQQLKALLLKNRQLIVLLLLCGLGGLAWYDRHKSFQSVIQQPRTSSSLVKLRTLDPRERLTQLKTLANAKRLRSLPPDRLREHHRVLYLLAIDLIEQGQGQQALTYLHEIKDDYDLLRPQVLFKIALAYRQNQKDKAARKTLKYLIKTYPDSPLVANALLLLETDKTLLLDTLVKKFPYHPLTHKIARQGLSQDKDRFELLIVLARYSRDENLNSVRDRLVLEYSHKLTARDWEIIADGYWRSGEHRKAADAYIFAEPTPRNLYRAAKGFHRNGNIATAKRAYQRLLREYHDATEAGRALIDLANISSGDEAVVYLEKAIAKFPQVAPQAYLDKALVHERFSKYEAAKNSRQQLLNRYGDSVAATKYRWTTAQKLAANGNKSDALSWMQPIIELDRMDRWTNFASSSYGISSDFVPKALYQTAKWAQELDRTNLAKTTWEKIIKLYPQSYWAWRAAVKLGWVEDFTQLRSLSPTLDLAKIYSPLPTGSEALQELYLLGQYRDAWLLLQSEFERPQSLDVDEQFTEGLLKIELGRYSEGMQEIWNLTKRDTLQELQQWRTLRQSSAYWYGLFPFPHQKLILQYARKNQINPLLAISVMRKESTFNPEIESVVGAVGLMQIVPPTARWVGERLELSDYSLVDPEDNIEIGFWYLKHNHQRYDDDSLLAVASYNAGTGNVNAWLDRYELDDRDRFVELIPFPETKDYVEGVFGNYWNYLQLYNPEIRQKIEDLPSP
jgi:soluble lytic murein transglycosylase